MLVLPCTARSICIVLVGCKAAEQLLVELCQWLAAWFPGTATSTRMLSRKLQASLQATPGMLDEHQHLIRKLPAKDSAPFENSHRNLDMSEKTKVICRYRLWTKSR
jgi:hypothetical protein